MQTFRKNEEAFTGLEAAIVLIAFVVVAAVFSYVMLGAGFFTSQKSQEVVHTSVAQASSSMEVAGAVVGKGSTAADKLGEVTFYLQLTSGGSAADLKKTSFAVITDEAIHLFAWDNGNQNWKEEGAAITATRHWEKYIQTSPDEMLEPGELVSITISLGDAAGSYNIQPNDKFTVDVRPAVGAALPIVKHAPPSIEAGKFYELY